MRRWHVLAVCACVALVSAYFVVRAFPSAPPKDELRWVPIENRDIFRAIGVRVCRVHIPADVLRGKRAVVLTRERNGEKEPLLLGKITFNDEANQPLEVTTILQFDDPFTFQARRMSCVFMTPHTRVNTGHENPVAGFDRYAEGDDPRGLTTATGAELCVFSKGEGKDEQRVRFVLRLEER